MSLSYAKSVLRSPAVQAFFIQCVSFFLLLIPVSVGRLAEHLSVGIFLLLQGVVAAFLSYWRRLAPWWLLIQFVFPAALLAMLSLDWPPSIFLVGFLFLLGLYWTTFRTQVPFFPSGPAVWQAVAELLPVDHSLHMADVGSGFGGLVLDLARRRPESFFVGVEVAPLPWLASVLRARIGHSRARFIRDDYNHLDFSQYDVVFAYLSPAAMPGIWKKAEAEMLPGALFLSYEFPIPNVKSHIIIVPEEHGPTLFGWRM